MEIWKYNTKKTKIILLIVGFIISNSISFILGKKSVKIKEKVKIEYVKGDPIHDTIPGPKPSVEYKMPDDKTLVEYCIEHNLLDFLEPSIYIDSIFPTEFITEYVQVDTSKILNDWSTLRKYDLVLFNNDTIGEMKIHPEVQFNKLGPVSYEFTPVTKQVNITKSKEDKFSPFFGAGLGTKETYNIQAGLFYKKVGLGYQYRKEFNNSNNEHTVNVFIKL